MGFRFDLGTLDPKWSEVSTQPTHDLFSKGAPFQDVGAFAYYASWGAADPKAPLFEIPSTMRLFNIGFTAAYFRQLPFAMVVGGFLGWAFDPADRREGGLLEREQTPPGPDSYFGRGYDDPWSTW